MTPVHCITKHDPNAGTFGDCVRACVASILDLDAAVVPHFFHDDCDGFAGNARIRDYLASIGCAPFMLSLPGDASLTDVMDMMGVVNPTTYYMLFGATENGDHVVVCQGGEIAHDPAWCASHIVGPGSGGFWSVMAIARS